MALSLVTLFKNAFSSLIRLKGEKYFLSHLVEIVFSNKTLVQFEIQGSQLYQVEFEFLPQELKIMTSCSCSHFEEGFFCKHIWAAILKSDQEKLFEEIGNIPNIEIDQKRIDLSQTDAFEEVNPPFTWQEISKNTVIPMTLEKNEPWKEMLIKTQTKNYDLFQGSPQIGSRSKVGHYAIDFENSLLRKKITIKFFAQEKIRNDFSGSIKPIDLKQEHIALFSDVVDQEILWSLLGKTELHSNYNSMTTAMGVTSSVIADGKYAEIILKQIGNADKLYFCEKNRHQQNLSADGAKTRYDLIKIKYHDEPWNFILNLKKIESSYFLTASFAAGNTIDSFTTEKKKRYLSEVLGVVNQFVFFSDSVVRSNIITHLNWYELFKKVKNIEIPEVELNQFLEFYFSNPLAPTLDLPDDINFKEKIVERPLVRLSFSRSKNSSLLHSTLLFIYDETLVPFGKDSPVLYNIQKREKINRNFEFESDAYHKFLSLDPTIDGDFNEKTILTTIEKAFSFGWEVIAHERKVSVGRNFNLKISSQMDWFDLQGNFNFGNLDVSLPRLLKNVKSGQRLILFEDGSYGVLPENWMARFKSLSEMAPSNDEKIRLNKVQALYLGANLSSDDNFKADKKFNDILEIITELNNLKPRDPDEHFHGKLRSYQKEGLSWLSLISKHHVGGILADDMGLGKTIQVLALFSKEVLKNKEKKPSLIVAPKSLIFNWMKESEKFTPDLTILNYTGNSRKDLFSKIQSYNVILTTYQTLRSDIEQLKSIDFDFFILDEAQYIKNATSQAAIACRLIKANKKLALTGTPVENSVSDLFSILTIVSPGLISTIQMNRWIKEREIGSFKFLAKSLRPFILRRTKEQVLKDLPEKSEQILYCELSAIEKKKYDELKAFYWNSISGKIKDQGLAKSKFEVLEALLRLRQAACHQGLLDEQIKEQSSTKFDLLLEQINSVINDGHKALIFSQFTSLLGLLKHQLEKRNISFEYLDGKTINRQERIENFQNNVETKIFLLSLKAGGVGLNLTSADYVFILDPWWNPAAEAQAIDRTHRIGQTKKVFAYKIITKDTVEEKILELQKSKKELAKNLISDEENIIKSLKMEDLATLFQ